MPDGPTEIAQFLYYIIESDISPNIFGPNFQSYDDFCGFLDEHLGDQHDIRQVWSLKGQNRAAWSAVDFQALYIACWIYKPMEKGTYFLRMTDSEAANVKVGYEKLPSRKSSHLSGSGRSAHDGWAFLKGYAELLVQWQETGGRTYLMLKAEGHTTGITSLYSHLKSWLHKKRTGAGLMANADLNQIATYPGTPVIARGAENFSKEYEEFLKDLGKKRNNNCYGPSLKLVRSAKASCTVRDMLNVLSASVTDVWGVKTNQEVREKLTALAQRPNETTINAYVNVDISPGIKAQFLRFAQLFLLENRPDKIYNRYFEEVHVNPAQLTNAVRDFMGWNLPNSLRGQTQRRARMLNF